ncbi:unnamed protein product [Spirodela intermedia]|uniref:Uncharacterized protein n=1 Tax=Spirodela intermedia TaxID=51605 RepID=A0A7I8IJD2_SPIIN|nr:unnamed protein product [Spirodela intermedia]CAA6657075.1 unnamed protein product [Spirodela intermedia]
MRHGDRIDQFEPLWTLQAARPWDPPLMDDGKIRAWTTGRRLRVSQLGFRIHRVTAKEVVSALCARCENEASLLALQSSQGVPIDPSAVKVSIEFGLCEVISSQTIKVDWATKDGIWFPDVSELEIVLPAGTVDHSVWQVYHELPLWEEEMGEARKRYKKVILALADKYPNENLLLVTHGEAVGVSVAAFLEGFDVAEVDFCAYSHLQRKISYTNSGGLFVEPFKVLTKDGQNGISLYSL